MATNYTVRADVVDIRADNPRPTDHFLIDTNVWYWLVYTRAAMGANPPRTRQLSDYPNYINQALANGAGLRCCGLTLAELAHIIEKTEREIFSVATGFDAWKTKEFRHNYPAQRVNVVAEVQSVWSQVCAVADSMEAIVNDSMTAAAASRFAAEAVDGYDLFLLEAAIQTGVLDIITDDGDFCGVTGFRIFTSNPAVLAAAQAQGRLAVR